MQPKLTLTPDDYQKAASLLGVEVAVVKAVAEVESNGKGFMPDGRLVIRFEGHVFRQYSGRKFDKTHPTVSHPYYSDGRYNKGVANDYKRLAVAMSLDKDAALKACSLGGWQIMAYHHTICGFVTVDAFWDAMKRGIDEQLLAFCRFCIAQGLADELREKRWADFSRRYNGENYAAGKYDLKLAAAYRKYSTPEVREALAG